MQHDTFAIARCRPYFNFDIGTNAGDAEGGVAQVDFDALTGNDHGVVLRWPEFDFGGFDELTHLNLNFPAQDHGVGVFRLLAQDVVDSIECFFVVFLVHQDLGAGVIDLQAECGVFEAHEFIELTEGA